MSDIVQDSSKPTFLYWKLAARAQTPMLMLHAAKIPYQWDENVPKNWPQDKDNMPFGQLPVLKHGDLQIAQSGTITRYCANLSTLYPEDLKQQLQSDMLIEHSNDIFNLMGKAKYSGNDDQQKYQWHLFKSDKLPDKLKWLEKMLGTNNFFCSDKVSAGDVAVFSVLNLVVSAGHSEFFDKFKSLKEHYDRVSKIGTIPEYLTQGIKPYFVIPQ
tara:strand:+ start:3967 stop:4608 length:642 start_codon:yes stop_codon:yes gene_type:complete